MKITGNLVTAHPTFSGDVELTFRTSTKDVAEWLKNVTSDILLSLEIKPYKKGRSLDANALMWACIGEMARALRADKWDIYLAMLKRYGIYEYVIVKPKAVEKMKQEWRTVEEIGEIDIHGQKGVQLLCYFGSSTYNTQEFSVLLDGIVSEMKEMGLQPPTSNDMKRSLEEWERLQKKKENRHNAK